MAILFWALSFLLCYLHVPKFKRLINTNFFQGNDYMAQKFIGYYFGNPAQS